MDFLQWTKRIWELQLWQIESHPVTLGKLIIAVLVLFVGLWFVKHILAAAAKRAKPYLHFRESTFAAIFKLILYSSYVLLILLALNIVEIPLTAFAFLGGALAIGIGFGGQQLINNFISGFILMAERPIRIDDLVEVEKVIGKVEEIGARSTKIRTGENIHILVPNSKFLETIITNWTFSDKTVKTKISVGVVYGSPVGEVRRLLTKAVTDTEKTLKNEPPLVLFKDFGNNALIFEVYFWIRVTTPLERKIIESEVRFLIDELFRETGIVIAFPQRDTHLYSAKPLEIRLLPENSFIK